MEVDFLKGDVPMFAVHFYEKNNLFISQLLNQIPTEGAEIKLKGRKGKVLSVTEIEPDKFNVQIELETLKKPSLVSSVDKKKKR